MVPSDIYGGKIRGEAGCPLCTDRSVREQRQIDGRAVLREAAEVAAGAATAIVTETATEATTMTEGE